MIIFTIHLQSNPKWESCLISCICWPPPHTLSWTLEPRCFVPMWQPNTWQCHALGMADFLCRTLTLEVLNKTHTQHKEQITMGQKDSTPSPFLLVVSSLSFLLFSIHLLPSLPSLSLSESSRKSRTLHLAESITQVLQSNGERIKMAKTCKVSGMWYTVVSMPTRFR